MDDKARLDEIRSRQAKWDEDPFGVPPDENNPAFIAERLEMAWLAEQVPFLLQQLDERDQALEDLKTSHTRTVENCLRKLAAAEAEIQRLRKIEDAAWKAVETMPFDARDVYHADARAMENLSVVLEQNRGDE